MLLHYNLEKLNHILQSFYTLTGISVSILDAQRKTLATFPQPVNAFCRLIHTSPEGKRRCGISDRSLLSECYACKHAVSHTCHAGLMDTAVPIVNGNDVVGFILFGQVCESQGDRTPFSHILPRISDLSLDEAALERTYESLMFFDRSKIEAAAELVDMLTKYICLGQMIRPQYSESFERILQYVEDNLTSELTVNHLCEIFHISKNTLYRDFRKYLNTTIKEYIADRRLLHAENLLRTTSLPVYEVCTLSGIENYHYFCRFFKERTGFSPLQYRKNNQKPTDRLLIES